MFALVLLLEAVVPFAGAVVLLAAVVGGALVEFPDCNRISIQKF